MKRMLHRGFWLLAALVCIVLGIIGILLPIMPGLLFFALALFCLMRCSGRFNSWIARQPWFVRIQRHLQRK